MEEEFVNLEIKGKMDPSVKKVGQEQIHSLLFGEKLSWQAIIYDLINTEQLDPWDIDLALLSSKYMEKVRLLEEANFFVSSKVLLAASLLLRIKSEILLNYDIQSLDDILFGKTEEKKYIQERIELDEEVPELVVRTPLPRFKKVSLQELMAALGKAIQTETRRIKKVVLERQQEIETAISLPKKTINITDKIKEVYAKLMAALSEKETKMAFSEFSSDEDRILTFIPLLHLDYQSKVFLEQEGHLEEIWIWLNHIYESKNKELLEKMRREVEAELEMESLEEFRDEEDEDEEIQVSESSEKDEEED